MPRTNPANASFYPFGIYSPEWQAMRWALTSGRPVRFIDLPAANRLALRTQANDRSRRAQRTTSRKNPPRKTTQPGSRPFAATPSPTSPRSPATTTARPGGTR